MAETDRKGCDRSVLLIDWSGVAIALWLSWGHPFQMWRLCIVLRWHRAQDPNDSPYEKGSWTHFKRDWKGSSRVYPEGCWTQSVCLQNEEDTRGEMCFPQWKTVYDIFNQTTRMQVLPVRTHRKKWAPCLSTHRWVPFDWQWSSTSKRVFREAFQGIGMRHGRTLKRSVTLFRWVLLCSYLRSCCSDQKPLVRMTGHPIVRSWFPPLLEILLWAIRQFRSVSAIDLGHSLLDYSLSDPFSEFFFGRYFLYPLGILIESFVAECY